MPSVPRGTQIAKRGEALSKAARQFGTMTKGKQITTQFAQVKLARERAQLEKVSLDLLVYKGVLVRKQDVMDYVVTCNTLVMSRLLGMPDKIAPRLIRMTTPHIAAIIRDELREILEEMAYAGGTAVPEPGSEVGVDNELELVLEDLETEGATDGDTVG